MLYSNNSVAALAACERERTCQSPVQKSQTTTIEELLKVCPYISPESFKKMSKGEYTMANPNSTYDNLLYEIKDCEIIKDLTPARRHSDKIYLCKCNICGNTFTRCRKTLVYHHSDCGCVSNTPTTGVYADRMIKGASLLAKRVMLAKLNALKLENAAVAFEALYIQGKPYGEYTAMSLGMSLSTLYRARQKIRKLWAMEGIK